MGLTSEKMLMMDLQQRMMDLQQRRKKWAIENPDEYKEWKERKNEKLKREREREIERERKERNVITNYFRKTI